MSRWFVRNWFWVVLACGVVLHALTLPYSPVHWQDEVQVNEIGRLAVTSSDWSMYWVDALGEKNGASPVSVWNVGSVFSELGYRTFGEFGSRIVMLLALVLSSLLVRAYLRRKTDDLLVADLLSLVYFAAPQLVESVRTARADVLAFLFLFAGLTALRSLRLVPALRFGLAGLFSAFCVFSWATAILTVPLVAFEIVDVWQAERWGVRRGARYLGIAALGALLASAVALSTVFPHWRDVMAQFARSVPKGAGMACCVDWRSAAAMMLGAPFLYFVALVCLLPRKGMWLLSMGAFGFLAICLMNRFYTFRVMYFLPYAIIAIAVTTMTMRTASSRRFMVGVDGVLLVLCLGCSVVARNALEFLSRDYRNDEPYRTSLTGLIGRGERVYSFPYFTYYIGRELGWRQFRPADGEDFGACDEAVSSRSDWMIVESCRISPDIDRFLAKAHFVKVAEVNNPMKADGHFIAERLDAIGFLKPLPDIVVFRREKP